MIEPIKIRLEDFGEVSKKNKYWLWHLIDNVHHPLLEIQPLDEEPSVFTQFHTFKEIVEKTKVPVYQTSVYEVVDFLFYLDNNILTAMKKKNNNELGPHILAFEHNRLVDHTINRCYCSEGIINILLTLNPELLNNFLDD